MALAATRIGDEDVIHCNTPKRMEGAGTVFVNGKPWSLMSHKNDPHLKPNPNPPPECITHSKPIAKGSSTVFVEGKGAGRVTDKILECTAVAQGSPDTFCG